jgi:hypothetical protein
LAEDLAFTRLPFLLFPSTSYIYIVRERGGGEGWMDGWMDGGREGGREGGRMGEGGRESSSSSIVVIVCQVTNSGISWKFRIAWQIGLNKE